MRKTFIIIQILLLLLVNFSLFKKNIFNQNESLTGLIKFVGNIPLVNAVLETDEKRHYYLPGDFINKNKDIVGKRVTLNGKVKKKVIKSADHKYKIVRYYLENIKIIKVF
jgi:hypothetical protein